MKEKTLQEKNAAERQVELLTDALASAKNNNGYWLNVQGKTSPKFYPGGWEVSPFNSLVMGLNSDKNGYKTNLYTLFSEAKLRGEGVREHEKGVPFNWYAWNKYVNRNNPDDIISRKDYVNLPKEEQAQYKGVHNREIRTVFNIDQTLLPMVDADKYEEQVVRHGGDTNRIGSDAATKGLRITVNDFITKMKDNLIPMRRDGSGVAHYDSQKDAIYMPKQESFEHYHDYVQEMLRQVVSATGNQQRLSREGMMMKFGNTPVEDTQKQERLVVEIASGLKMLELGLPAKLSNESLGMIDYWNKELKENPCLIDIVETDVNNALNVIHKAEQGEKVKYSSHVNKEQTDEMKDQLPKHFYVADEIRNHPDEETKHIVLVRDKEAKVVDVVLPAGASLETNNEVPGMSKDRIRHALEKEGFEEVKFYNADGYLGYRPDDAYFDQKDVTIARLRNWNLEDISKLDVTQAVAKSKEVGFDRIQMIQDDSKRWAMYIKPEGKEAFSIYPDKSDLNRFFSTLKQAQDNVDNLRIELAQKYYALSEVKPDLKVDLFSTPAKDVDMDLIEKVSIFRTKNDVILCSASIKGMEKQPPRVVSPSQWQRLWIAEDKNDYKKHLAATLFADVLRKGQNLEQTSNEKQEQEVENKQKEQTVASNTEEKKQQEKQQEEKTKEETTKAETKDVVGVAIKPILKQFLDQKAKHPEAVLLFRCGDFYETYMQDAEKASKILGITFTRSSKEKDPEGKPLSMAGFPYHALDTYLPKLIRAGERVAICDQIEAPKQTAKRGIDEMVQSEPSMEKKQEAQPEQRQAFHR